MAQPKEMKQDETGNDMIDKSKVYSTDAIVCTVGRAVAIDLNQCELPGNAKNKHMTILFRKSPRWSPNEIELMSKETDNWVKQKYGSVQTSVTFTIENWGKKSVKILGDLNELCLHLRSTFSSMSDDSQRIPHVELFTKHGGNKNRYNKKKDGKDKKDKKDKNYMKKDGKIRDKLERMITKMKELKLKKQQEISLLDEEEKQLEKLLNDSDNLDFKTLKHEIKNIAKSFKIKRKEMKLRNKKGGKGCKGGRGGKRGKGKGRGGGRGRGIGRGRGKGRDSTKKEEKRLIRQQKKLEKKERLETLSLARLDNLPLLSSDIGNKSVLNIYVDGYNIIGCDSICRKLMRKKGGGMKKSRKRLIDLLQNNFINKINNKQLLFNYNINDINLYFDGNGKNEEYQNIKIIFSTKKQIVDDKLVELLSKNTIEENSNNLVVTTDKELTLRLHKIGVKVIKSSTFYKKYLKEEQEEEEESNDDEKESNDDNAPDVTIDEDDFVQIMAQKLNYHQTNQEEGVNDGNDDNDYDKVGEDTPDEDYSDDNHNDNDYEFTSIFGEDMDLVDSD